MKNAHALNLIVSWTIVPVGGAALAQPIELTWSSLDAGVQKSTAGSLELTGTIGQVDAGRRLASTDHVLTGGFWSGGAVTPDCLSDLNDDGVADLADFLQFFNQFDQEGFGSDVNMDNQLDFADFLSFFNSFDTGC